MRSMWMRKGEGWIRCRLSQRSIRLRKSTRPSIKRAKRNWGSLRISRPNAGRSRLAFLRPLPFNSSANLSSFFMDWPKTSAPISTARRRAKRSRKKAPTKFSWSTVKLKKMSKEQMLLVFQQTCARNQKILSQKANRLPILRLLRNNPAKTSKSSWHQSKSTASCENCGKTKVASSRCSSATKNITIPLPCSSSTQSSSRQADSDHKANSEKRNICMITPLSLQGSSSPTIFSRISSPSNSKKEIGS